MGNNLEYDNISGFNKQHFSLFRIINESKFCYIAK